MTNDERAQFEAALSELANAAQVLAGHAVQLRQFLDALSTASDSVLEVEAATDRVLRAVHLLRPESRR